MFSCGSEGYNYYFCRVMVDSRSDKRRAQYAQPFHSLVFHNYFLEFGYSARILIWSWMQRWRTFVILSAPFRVCSLSELLVEQCCGETLVCPQWGSVGQLDVAFLPREETDFLRDEAEARYPTVMKKCDKTTYGLWDPSIFSVVDK